MTPELLARCAQPDGPVRPTFCNVPHWAELFLYAGGALAIGLFAYGLWRHWRVWFDGRPDAPARNTGDWPTRAGFLGRYVIGHVKTAERRYPGIFHAGLFWGFALLFVGTTLATIDWDVTRLLWGGRILSGRFYLAYEWVLDTAGVTLLVGLVLALWRRHVAAPRHVSGAWDFMLWSLVFISLTGFLVEGLRLVLEPLDWGGYSWVGQGLASAVFAWGSPGFIQDTVPALHLWLWLAHAAASLLFIAALPYSNAIHMFTTSANAVLQSTAGIAPGAALQTIDLETAEVWGAGKLADLTWKQRLGVDACVRCGRCETVCPAHMAGTPLNPKRVIVNLSDALRDELDGPLRANGDGEVMIGAEALIDPDALWGCTTCMACVEVCPAFIEIVDDIVDMRRYLTLNEGALPGTSAATLKNMGGAGNPWGYAQEDRLAWAEGLDVPVAEDGEHYEVLYWVGCSGSYDARNQKISRAVARLLAAAGVRFAVMREERCNCESARRLGEEYLFQTAAAQNVESLSRYTFERIVCHCPHCFNTLHNEYGAQGGDYEVVHHSQLIRELLEAGRLPRAAEGAARRVAFHDSCYLGRYNGEFDAPRGALAAAGAEVVELPRRRENGLCCGGGGGQMWFEGPSERDVGVIRMEEILETRPDAVGVACPFCLTMLDSAARSMGADEVKIQDVAEVLADALDPDPPAGGP